MVPRAGFELTYAGSKKAETGTITLKHQFRFPSGPINPLFQLPVRSRTLRTSYYGTSHAGKTNEYPIPPGTERPIIPERVIRLTRLPYTVGYPDRRYRGRRTRLIVLSERSRNYFLLFLQVGDARLPCCNSIPS